MMNTIVMFAKKNQRKFMQIINKSGIQKPQ